MFHIFWFHRTETCSGTLCNWMDTKVGLLRVSAPLVSSSHPAIHHFWFHPFSFHVFYWFHPGAYLSSADAVMLQLGPFKLVGP